ncbi:MAG: DUF6263 family protein [Candidatus Omnitrophica bacterium]|nr:DUF6263 family protein [Candidatus Omnitrophota bacterium]
MKRILIILGFFVITGGLYCEEVPTATQSTTEEIKEEPVKYTIIYKFPQGKEIYYQLSMDRKDDFNVAGKKFDVKKKTVVYLSELFQGVDENGNGLIKVTYLQGWQDNIRIFSQPKEVKAKMSPKGEILESEGLQEIAAEFFKVLQYNLADYIPGIDRLPVKIDFSKMPSNTFNIYWQAFLFPVPEKPVAIGDMWKREDKNAGITIQYKLQEVKEGKAYIEVITEDKRGFLEGKAIFDIENGYLILNYVNMVTDSTGKIAQRAAKEISGATGTEVKPASTLPERTHITFKMEFVPMEE